MVFIDVLDCRLRCFDGLFDVRESLGAGKEFRVGQVDAQSVDVEVDGPRGRCFYGLLEELEALLVRRVHILLMLCRIDADPGLAPEVVIVVAIELDGLFGERPDIRRRLARSDPAIEPRQQTRIGQMPIGAREIRRLFRRQLEHLLGLRVAFPGHLAVQPETLEIVFKRPARNAHRPSLLSADPPWSASPLAQSGSPARRRSAMNASSTFASLWGQTRSR